ncbi:unnamed protein product [Cladocopium goreaui]|uniref:Uncharacterized protein n=1 Tax=Cladocopium goreaui TaxID=2562237 RepID=A0A9P1M0F8_9DINO|nr:unnamed protein product [Cladocopium goreaui]
MLRPPCCALHAAPSTAQQTQEDQDKDLHFHESPEVRVEIDLRTPSEQQQDRLPGDDEEPMAVPSPSPLQRGKSGILSTPEKEGRFPETQKVSSPVVPKRLEEHFEENKVSKTLPPFPVALPKPAPQQDRMKAGHSESAEWETEETTLDMSFDMDLPLEVGGADVVPGDEDGGLPPSAQETMKLLKRLGYPEVQDTTKPSALLTKVSTALTKRMGKLEEVKKLFAAGGDSALVRKMCDKLEEVYAKLDSQSEALSAEANAGILEGFTQEKETALKDMVDSARSALGPHMSTALLTGKKLCPQLLLRLLEAFNLESRARSIAPKAVSAKRPPPSKSSKAKAAPKVPVPKPAEDTPSKTPKRASAGGSVFCEPVFRYPSLPGEETSRQKMLEVLADEIGDGVWRLALVAPACRVGTMARAAVADGAPNVGSLYAATKVHPSHGERDAHRLLNKYWLSLRVPISELTIPLDDGQTVSIPHYKVTDMAGHLLTKHPEILLGGDTLESGESRCKSFWEKFRDHQPDHKVFQQFVDFRRVVPICIHGDKGRTLKKSPIACYSWESVWGLPAGLRDTATEPVLNRRNQQKYDTGHLGVTCLERSTSSNGGGTYDDADDACTIKRRRLGQCGHSFLNRYLFTCVPYAVYSLDSYTVLRTVLKELGSQLKSLFLDGVEVNSTTYHFALIGVKGDAEFHVEAGEFCRSYMTVGTANNLQMCHECEADDNFGDVSDNPSWLNTVA